MLPCNVHVTTLALPGGLGHVEGGRSGTHQVPSRYCCPRACSYTVQTYQPLELLFIVKCHVMHTVHKVKMYNSVFKTKIFTYLSESE